MSFEEQLNSFIKEKKGDSNLFEKAIKAISDKCSLGEGEIAFAYNPGIEAIDYEFVLIMLTKNKLIVLMNDAEGENYFKIDSLDLNDLTHIRKNDYKHNELKIIRYIIESNRSKLCIEVTHKDKSVIDLLDRIAIGII